MKYAFIVAHRAEFSARSMCRVLAVHFSGFYAWVKELLSQRALEDARQTDLTQQAWANSGSRVSITLRPGGFRMTPLYDVLSAQKAVDDGQIRQNRMRLAMAVDGHYQINEVEPRHFLQAAKAAGFGVALAEEVLSGVASELEPALHKTLADLPDGFPQPLAKAIAAGIQHRAIAFHAV